MLVKIFCSLVLVWITAPIPYAASGGTTREVLSGLVKNYFEKSVVHSFPSRITLEEASSMQAGFIKEIGKRLGPQVGYKAGLSNRTIQKRFGIAHPLRGALLEKMLLPSGSTVTADFGALPVLEGDLIVRIGNDDINDVGTIEETLHSIDAVIPFIELPDLLFAKEISLNAAMITAVNLGARLGVVGEPVPVLSPGDWEERLKNMRVEITDETGKKIAAGHGNSLLGNPLEVVLWIRDSLKAEGKKLKKGDLLSLGSLTPMIPVKSGSAIRAAYMGLDSKKTVEVTVRFE